MSKLLIGLRNCRVSLTFYYICHLYIFFVSDRTNGKRGKVNGVRRSKSYDISAIRSLFKNRNRRIRYPSTTEPISNKRFNRSRNRKRTDYRALKIVQSVSYLTIDNFNLSNNILFYFRFLASVRIGFYDFRSSHDSSVSSASGCDEISIDRRGRYWIDAIDAIDGR